MTIAELITELQSFPPDALVVMAKDSEGNNYSPLSEMDTALYLAHSTWSGDLVDEEDHDEDEDIADSAVSALVLWPVN